MKVALSSVALLAILAAAAHAQAGINLLWNDCAAGGGVSEMAFACDSSFGEPFLAVISVVLSDDVQQCIGVTAAVQACFGSPTLPPWWQTRFGQCRFDAITISLDSQPDASSCPDFWQGAPVTQVSSVGQESVDGTLLQLNAGAAMDTTLSLVADGRELTLGRVVVRRSRTTGPSACAGCSDPAWMSLRAVGLHTLQGLGDRWLTAASTNNVVAWNASWTYTCTVPTANRTWGAVKSLFR